MRLEVAPSVDEGEECGLCGAEDAYVLYDNDKMCEECGYVPGVVVEEDESLTEWAEWIRHRAKEYSGWYGEERVKFAGGFVAAYVFEEDFN